MHLYADGVVAEQIADRGPIGFIVGIIRIAGYMGTLEQPSVKMFWDSQTSFFISR